MAVEDAISLTQWIDEAGWQREPQGRDPSQWAPRGTKDV